MTTVEIAGIPIGDGHPTRICAEIGTNHGGDLNTALRLIDAAKAAGCDFLKFQKRTPELAVPEAEWNDARSTPWGTMTKLMYRKRVEFGENEYQEIDAHCKKVGIPWFASVWDLPSLKFIETWGSPCHKIPSARLHDDGLIAAVAQTGKPIILSTGMSTMNDVAHAVNVLRRSTGGPLRYILMQCTSAYPARADESNLRVIRTYRQAFGCPVGFSSHKIGIATCVLAVAAGANLIERHITYDRSAKGSDHRMSSTKDDLARLVVEIIYAEASLGDGIKRVFPSEEAERKRLRGAK